MKYISYETRIPHHDLVALEIAGAVQEAIKGYLRMRGMRRVPDDFLCRVVSDRKEWGQRISVIIAEEE